jgi:deoxycytidylate deaminase
MGRMVHATLHHTPRFVTTDMNALINAAVAGVGVLPAYHEALKVSVK